MKYVVFLVGGLLLLSATASAQEDVEAASEPDVAAEEAPADAEPAPEEEKRSVYYKKVQGWLWIEGFVGPSSYDADSFASLDIGASVDAPKVKGPEGGLSIMVGLGGFGLGWFYRQANYDTFKLMKTGLDMQGVFRFVPYVHPTVRIDIGYAKTFNGSPYGSAGAALDESNGFVVTLGAGLRIPIIRWMSFAATFDWSVIGLWLRSSAGGGSSAILGQQLGGTFALTFHFIGVRKN